MRKFVLMTDYTPLAERMRPRRLEEVEGQPHLTGPDGILTRMLKENFLPSLLFYGPPGTGKTTLAKIIADLTGRPFYRLSAVSAGVKDIKQILDKHPKGSLFPAPVVFIDEIHRFNKAQQDALLHAVETGQIILIGATTENPGFEVNNALLSRMHTLAVRPLDEQALRRVLDRALKEDPVMKSKNIRLQNPDKLIALSGGDARRMLNLLEAVAAAAGNEPVTDEQIEEVARHMPGLYDKKGDWHYDMASAFIKSIRGSDPDAALYWLARMLHGGEDPLFIARRLIISAAEDVGMANPQALTVAEAGFASVEKIGMPEGQIVLAQVTVYLATSPKSNASYKGLKRALTRAKETAHLPVPLHLRKAANRFMKESGAGKDYRNPHRFPGHFVRQHYFPPHMEPEVFYIPADNARERKIREALEKMWKRSYPGPSPEDKEK
ncbi:MAG: replication-associated recombination protein A [Chlorobi bacterium]|nr:replication-associated recombination protein A [Chlorobiota bacterium]